MMGYCSSTKRGKLPSAATRIDLEDMTPSEISQKDKHCMTSPKCGLENYNTRVNKAKEKRTHKRREQTSGHQSGEGSKQGRHWCRGVRGTGDHMWSRLREHVVHHGGCGQHSTATLHGVSPLKPAAAAKSLQSCPPLCDPMDGSPPGSPVPGILQARTLEWVAISFSNAWKWEVKLKSLSRVQLLQPHGWQPTRLLRLWDSPGKSTGVGCHCLLPL